jgi:zeaxanthin glucosyltransferase
VGSDSFRNIPPNAIVVKWVPQVELLQRASIAITHGGMNTIKSCIFFGVPIIIFPIDRETPMNAARIVYHGLGVRGNIKRNSVQHFRSLIEEIDENPLLRLRVELMGKKFRQLEASGRGVQIIEGILDQINRRKSGQQRPQNPNQTFPFAARN